MKNQSGSAFLFSLVLTLILGTLSTVFLQMSLNLESNTRLPIIKSIMLRIEGEIRQALLQSTTYTNCDSTIGSSSCQIITSTILNTAKIVPGAQCPSGKKTCGVVVSNINFNGASRIFTAQLIYEGQELSVSPQYINVVVPSDILQSSEYLCPDATPFFSGYQSNGKPNCKALPTSCLPGQYISSIDKFSLTLNCTSLPSDLHCASDQFISNLYRNSENQFAISCAPRPTPVLNPSLVTNTVPTVPPLPTPTLMPTPTLIATPTPYSFCEPATSRADPTGCINQEPTAEGSLGYACRSLGDTYETRSGNEISKHLIESRYWSTSGMGWPTPDGGWWSCSNKRTTFYIDGNSGGTWQNEHYFEEVCIIVGYSMHCSTVKSSGYPMVVGRECTPGTIHSGADNCYDYRTSGCPSGASACQTCRAFTQNCL